MRYYGRIRGGHPSDNRARELFPFGIECKAQETLNIWQALEQARINAEKEKLMPLLVFKRNRSDIYVCLRLADFLGMVTKGAIRNGDCAEMPVLPQNIRDRS